MSHAVEEIGARNTLIRRLNANHLAWATVISVTVLAALLRFYKLGEHSFWLDEAASVNNVRAIFEWDPNDAWGPFSFLREDRVPPLYFFLLAPFYQVSQSESVLRLLSVVFGILSIPIVYFLGAKLFNKGTGILAALILAFSPFHIYYSQELRPYSLFLFFSLLAYCLSLLALRERRNIFFLGMSAAFVLGIYTHVYMVFALFLVDLFFSLGWKANRPVLPKWLLCHLAIGLFCIPEVYLLVYHILRGNTAFVDSPQGLRSLAGTFYLFTMGRFFFPNLQNLIVIVVQSILWGGFGLLIGVLVLWKERFSERSRTALLFFLAAAITYGAIWVVSWGIIPLFDEGVVHYLIFLLPFYITIVAAGWNSISNPAVKSTLVGLALILSLASLFPYYFTWDQVGRGNFRAASAFIQSGLEENDVIYHVNYKSPLPVSYYLNWQARQGILGSPNAPEFGSTDRFWLVVVRQTAGVDFSLSALMPQDNHPRQQEDSNAICAAEIATPEFELARSQVFPGKNELTVCFYRRLP